MSEVDVVDVLCGRVGASSQGGWPVDVERRSQTCERVKIPCAVCGELFVRRMERHKYCGSFCLRKEEWRRRKERLKAKEGLKPVEVPCALCGKVFTRKREGHKYCSNHCLRGKRWQVVQDKQERTGKVRTGYEAEVRTDDVAVETIPRCERHRLPRGRYVYGWYHPGDKLPFYVGKGTGRRAWEVHKVDYGHLKRGALAWCEQSRTSDTNVVIYRDNLTSEGALLVEAVLIELFDSMGANLTNQNGSMKRQERLPLE